VIRDRHGQELLMYEVGPYEIEQDLILECEVSGGECDVYMLLLLLLLPLLLSHHRPREIGRAWLWAELEKIARFKRLENSSLYFQNNPAFPGRIGKPNLSEFPVIY
jgi:hypothetical protein